MVTGVPGLRGRSPPCTQRLGHLERKAAQGAGPGAIRSPGGARSQCVIMMIDDARHLGQETLPPCAPLSV